MAGEQAAADGTVTGAVTLPDTWKLNADEAVEQIAALDAPASTFRELHARERARRGGARKSVLDAIEEKIGQASVPQPAEGLARAPGPDQPKEATELADLVQRLTDGCASGVYTDAACAALADLGTEEVAGTMLQLAAERTGTAFNIGAVLAEVLGLEVDQVLAGIVEVDPPSAVTVSEEKPPALHPAFEGRPAIGPGTKIRFEDSNGTVHECEIEEVDTRTGRASFTVMKGQGSIAQPMVADHGPNQGEWQLAE